MTRDELAEQLREQAHALNALANSIDAGSAVDDEPITQAPTKDAEAPRYMPVKCAAVDPGLSEKQVRTLAPKLGAKWRVGRIVRVDVRALERFNRAQKVTEGHRRENETPSNEAANQK